MADTDDTDETVDLACPVCSKLERGRPGSKCTSGHFPPVAMRAVASGQRSAIAAGQLARREAGERVLPNLIAAGGVTINDET